MYIYTHAYACGGSCALHCIALKNQMARLCFKSHQHVVRCSHPEKLHGAMVITSSREAVGRTLTPCKVRFEAVSQRTRTHS